MTLTCPAKRIITTAILVLALIATTASAQEKSDLRLKSTGLATILALDPIPGDALFYAGKPVQGTINLVLGGLSAAAFYGSLVGYLNESGPTPNCYDMSCSGMGKSIMGGLTIASAIPYLGFLIWDAVGGIKGVRAHNERVKKQRTSILHRIQPTVAVTKNGAFGGVRITF